MPAKSLVEKAAESVRNAEGGTSVSVGSWPLEWTPWTDVAMGEKKPGRSLEL